MSNISVSVYSEEEKLKAAYALNMCTVSVSQIVEYNDAYILEQEYEAILNNLNLENMPKDDALLKILTELLNTITFFRIQGIKKRQIEKKYQDRIKNAIWSSIPNIGVIVTSGNPIAIATALATQVGAGYMNYRKEKAQSAREKEDSEIELQIAAIEQFNALRRELFTTAWRLSAEYNFSDCYRLSERQIDQYNNILMDTDEYRKYARLEAIENKFKAYPPFWYFYAHTALFIATSERDRHPDVSDEYRKKARSHFETYQQLNRFNILREDQITASADLEYVDLLLLDNTPDYEKIKAIIDDAVEKAGNANDVLQLCAIAYLKAGKYDSAARVFKYLVNESYNAVANAKLLSRLYVSKYLGEKSQPEERKSAYSDYVILQRRVNPVHLFPMPKEEKSEAINEDSLQEQFMVIQRTILGIEFRNALDAYVRKYHKRFLAVLPVPNPRSSPPHDYYENTSSAKERRIEDAKAFLDSKNRHRHDYISRLKESDFRYAYIDILNQTVDGLEVLSCFHSLPDHNNYRLLIENKLVAAKDRLATLQKKLEDGSFDFDDYKVLVYKYSFGDFVKSYFCTLRNEILSKIESATNCQVIDSLEQDLIFFCEKNGLPSPDQYIQFEKTRKESLDLCAKRFEYTLIVDYNANDITPEARSAMKQIIENRLSDDIIKDGEKDGENVCISFTGSAAFNSYFENESLQIPGKKKITVKQETFGIVDDGSKKNCDLLLGSYGVILVKNNKAKKPVPYADIKFISTDENRMLKTPAGNYDNKNIKIEELNDIIKELCLCAETNSESAKEN